MKKLINSLFCIFLCSITSAQINAKLIQYPDISDQHICFTYGGDIWIVDKDGGKATKVTTQKGRETDAKFSPDGKTLAYEANYDGNYDIYTIPISGGIPQRVTGHGMYDMLIDWTPTGEDIIFASSMESGKQRFSQFYTVGREGGLPEKMPMVMASYGSLNDDGSKIAFTDKSRIFRTWKRYRGGTAPDIYVMDLNTLESEKISTNPANDERPMWKGDNIYYLSDRGENLRANIWVYNTTSKEHRQITTFKDLDIHYPSLGTSEIVFEAGGEIYRLDLATEAYNPVVIEVVSDMRSIKPKTKSVKDVILSYDISPDGNRALLSARGDVFTLPKEKGVVKNLTQTSGTAERYPAWSPDGKSIAYFSDKSGEYELMIRDIKQNAERKITNLGKGFRYHLFWSPDSKHLAFIDQSMTIHLVTIGTGTVSQIDQHNSLYEWGLRNFHMTWSPDSRYISYSNALSNGNECIYIYDTRTKSKKKITSGFYSDFHPTFGPDGKYLYFATNRALSPVYSDFDNTFTYPNATHLAMMTLTKDTKSPLLPTNDSVEIEEESEEPKNEKSNKKKKKKSKEENEAEEEKVETKIDFEQMEQRTIIIPVDPGNLGSPSAGTDKVYYLRYSNSGSGEQKRTLKYYDFEEEEEKTVISNIRSYKQADNREHFIVHTESGSFAIIDAQADQKAENMLPTQDMKSTIIPREEWKQIFVDAWRLQRDFFYDADMHGVDWEKVKDQYLPLIDQCMARSDVNYVIGEMIGELNASHTYRGGGDNESADRQNVGYLGVNWAKEKGQFKIKEIIRAAAWDTEVVSPLDVPGVDVSEGDYILAVNGVKLDQYTDPWQGFTGTANKTTELTVSKSGGWSDAESVYVKPLSSETRLRNLAWIESNRQKVDELSGGKLGYIYVPSTGIGGQNELIRMFYGQWQKEGLIIDERFNNGGQIPDRFIELLNRKPLAYFAVRDGKNWQWPPIAHFGPKAMLINGWSGSGGDAFPDYFRKSELGPLIGTRTWGGLIGISGAPTLIDGGGVTVPTFRMYDPDGTWFREGHGVDPDIEVNEDPTALARGGDPQLERAVEEVLKALDSGKTYKHPSVPAKEVR